MNESANQNPVSESTSSGSPEQPAVAMLAPDVGTLVEYGKDGFGKEPGRYRVNAWLRAAPTPKLDPHDFIGKILFESCQELTDKRDGQKKRMQFCTREEASHLSLTGVGGAIAPIEMCKVTGMVDWDPKLLAQERESARRLGASHEMIF
jgi:hypothetical protein